MAAGWVQLHDESWVDSVAPPRVILYSALGLGVRRLADVGVKIHALDISSAASTFDVITALRQLLPFPSWCGSSWDSVDDAFEELRQAMTLPAALIIAGIDPLLGRSLHLGLETVLRLNDLERAFSVAGDQLLVFFVDRRGA
jgi:hypothetical protein